MSITTPNGMTVPVEMNVGAPNGPDLVQLLGNEVDAFYGGKVANVAALPAAGEFPGQRIWVTDIESHAVWNPTANMWDGYWKTYTPTLSGVSGSTSAQWCRVGKDVDVEFIVTTSGTSSGVIGLTTPTNAATMARSCGTGLAIQGGGIATAIAWLTSATVLNFYASNGVVFGGSAPVAWANGHKISGRVSYREAA